MSDILNSLIERFPAISECKNDIISAFNLMVNCYDNGGKLLCCGNGGSAADCDHLVGELMKGFLKKRPVSNIKREEMKANCPCLEDEIISELQCGLPAVSLTSMTALNTAFCNDVDPELIYAQPLMALGNEKDILIAISTSGNSKNVYAAAKVAKALGLKVIGLTGVSGGKLKEIADICICVPEIETFKIQELHLPVYHYLCVETEAHFFG